MSRPAPARRSLILRSTLAFAAVFCLTIAGALGFLYWSTLGAERRAIDEAIAVEAEGLRSSLVGLSVTEMAAVVTRRSGESPGQRTVYMLATQSREYVAGNLREWPGGAEPAPGPGEFPLGAPAGAGAAGAVARGLVVTLPSGQRLLVGRNVTEIEDLRRRILDSFVWAFGLTALLGVAGGYAFSRRVASRLDAVNRNSEAILAGDLARRMPVSGRGDEFDELAENLNRMLARLADLVAAMREVADDIAHDMRTPISRLRSRIEVALMGPPDAAAYRHVLEQTVKDADGVLAMFNALLTIALAESGAPRDRFVAVDLAAIARQAAEVYEPLAEERGLGLAVDAPEPVEMHGEPHLITQAIANLLDNAVKYVPRGGRIRVCVARQGVAAVLEVADDGPGIPAPFRARALERFSRLEASRTAPGSGLGLSLVRAVVRLHGGTLALEDNRPGLRVALRLPAGLGG